jgi:hypothetical protein
MIEMYVNTLIALVRDVALLEAATNQIVQSGKTGPLTDEDAAILAPIAERCVGADAFFYLPQVSARAKRFKDAVTVKVKYDEIRYQLRALREEMDDELQNRMMFYMPPARATKFLASGKLLGENVARVFVDKISDIEEAGKCFGCARFTAVVFHLMRVMEYAVQKMGERFKVTGVESKEWQEIINAVNGRLNQMPKSDLERSVFAELVGCLTAVKFAWRNEVMHPKATYTEDEAADILQAVKTFTTRIAEVLG